MSASVVKADIIEPVGYVAFWSKADAKRSNLTSTPCLQNKVI